MKKFRIALVKIENVELELEANSLDEAKEIMLEKLDNDEIEFVYTPTKIYVVDKDDENVKLPKDDDWTVDYNDGAKLIHTPTKSYVVGK